MIRGSHMQNNAMQRTEFEFLNCFYQDFLFTDVNVYDVVSSIACVLCPVWIINTDITSYDERIKNHWVSASKPFQHFGISMWISRYKNIPAQHGLLLGYRVRIPDRSSALFFHSFQSFDISFFHFSLYRRKIPNAYNNSHLIQPKTIQQMYASIRRMTEFDIQIDAYFEN